MDEEFEEFDITAEQIDRVIDIGEPVQFGNQIMITYSTLPKMGETS